MSRHVLPGNPPIEVELRRSARARRLTLRVSRLDGRVVLTLPPRLPEREGLAFLTDREGWVRQTLAGHEQPERPRFGLVLPVEGVPLTLTAAAVRSPRIEGDALLIGADEARLAPRLSAFLRMLARDRLAASSDIHAARLGRRYGRLTLRDTRSRWGSCTARGDLMFNWRLVMAPAPVLDYVAAHEVAHLVEMNHSPAFWAVVARLCPDHARHRTWLRTHGSSLHRLRLED